MLLFPAAGLERIGVRDLLKAAFRVAVETQGGQETEFFTVLSGHLERDPRIGAKDQPLLIAAKSVFETQPALVLSIV